MTRIIIPAYNEAENLPSLLQAISNAVRAEPYHLYVVNDGSRDHTGRVLHELRPGHPLTILTHEINQGVAAAFRTGFTAAVREASDEDVVVLMESDGTSSVDLLLEMIAGIRRGADLVIASRYRSGGGYKNFPLKRLILSRGANLLFRVFFPMPGVTDYSIFYRAYRVPPLRAAMAQHGAQFITSETFLANTEVLLKLRPFLQRVEEVPFPYDYGRKRGKSRMKVGKNLRSYLLFLARHAFGRSAW